MRLLVLVKCVPHTETRVRIAADGRSLEEGDIKWVINPFDEYALEAALRIAEKHAGSDVTAVCLGDDRALELLRQCLAVGASRGVLLKDPTFAGADGLVTARVLAGACRALGFDLILAGKQGVGHDRSQVPVMVAEFLDLPHVAVVTRLELGDGKATCWREIEGGSEVVETVLPAVVSCQKGLNELRYASLKGIMAAKKKPVDVWGPTEIGLPPEQLAGKGAAETWLKLELPPPRPEGKILSGEPLQVARELVRLLSDDAKVI